MEERVMLSDSEFEIMESIWKADHLLTRTEILDEVNSRCGKNIKIGTVATFLQSLKWKGYIQKVDSSTKYPVYRALVSRSEYFMMSSREFQKRWGMDWMLDFAAECFAGKSKKEQEEFLEQLKSKEEKE